MADFAAVKAAACERLKSYLERTHPGGYTVAGDPLNADILVKDRDGLAFRVRLDDYEGENDRGLAALNAGRIDTICTMITDRHDAKHKTKTKVVWRVGQTAMTALGIDPDYPELTDEDTSMQLSKKDITGIRADYLADMKMTEISEKYQLGMGSIYKCIAGLPKRSVEAKKPQPKAAASTEAIKKKYKENWVEHDKAVIKYETVEKATDEIAESMLKKCQEQTREVFTSGFGTITAPDGTTLEIKQPLKIKDFAPLDAGLRKPEPPAIAEKNADYTKVFDPEIVKKAVNPDLPKDCVACCGETFKLDITLPGGTKVPNEKIFINPQEKRDDYLLKTAECSGTKITPEFIKDNTYPDTLLVNQPPTLDFAPGLMNYADKIGAAKAEVHKQYQIPAGWGIKHNDRGYVPYFGSVTLHPCDALLEAIESAQTVDAMIDHESPLFYRSSRATQIQD